jgi:hypothetical protein
MREKNVTCFMPNGIVNIPAPRNTFSVLIPNLQTEEASLDGAGTRQPILASMRRTSGPSMIDPRLTGCPAAAPAWQVEFS